MDEDMNDVSMGVADRPEVIEQIDINAEAKKETDHSTLDGNIRLNSLKIDGVNDLSTTDIKTYLDHYLNDTISDEQDKILRFRIQWIDDNSLNVIFESIDDCSNALRILSVFDSVDASINSKITDKRRSKPFIKNLFSKSNYQEDEKLNQEDYKINRDANNNIIFTITQSTIDDKKVRNARERSRYYLLHGEPTRKKIYKTTQRKNNYRKKTDNSYRDRDQLNKSRYEDSFEDDLFKSKKYLFKNNQNNHNPKLYPDFRLKNNDNNDDADDADDLFGDKFSNSIKTGIVGNRNNENNNHNSNNNDNGNDNDDDDLFPGFRSARKPPSAPKAFRESRNTSRLRIRSRSRSRSRSPNSFFNSRSNKSLAERIETSRK
ncbi:NCBP3 domain-containing protein ASCRUDRAFT_85321 [Ascoidea rubescens DSM 1968]|uniref:Uncharacterized protein n=1 Tax=Ascoidea rubescens DSM 1968 TaxID=1344418 RepID=A0A1D2VJJ9_9ASCO|nr:hypothetical protein ASCRUDRAFT_85321 [Ascoidea rubescens DSM 1968]ODV61788.1 hypothetical protein ASCRUDRAFT_85321 [Ascoidea rubescens DSM 1968]